MMEKEIVLDVFEKRCKKNKNKSFTTLIFDYLAACASFIQALTFAAFFLSHI